MNTNFLSSLTAFLPTADRVLLALIFSIAGYGKLPTRLPEEPVNDGYSH